ncbi:MAG: D-2-hydroxyacid dehydrogenase [Flavobacteriales bacterium]
MKRILANDGISQAGIVALQEAGFELFTQHVEQNQLIDYINENQIVGLLVRSATTVRKDLIDACPDLQLIGRGGVGMDNIDVDYARSIGRVVVNTPAASSHSVAELVFAHFLSLSRGLFDSNRQMPLEGETNFKGLKKSYSKGCELKGKTVGIIGFGRIGQATAKIAFGLGMNVLVYDKFEIKPELEVEFSQHQTLTFKVNNSSLEELLMQSDFLSIHVPFLGKALIGKEQFELMKSNVCIVNAARGGVVDEVELLKALDEGLVAHAGLDVFDNEPQPAMQVLMHPKLSLTPHIGGQTAEAQSRIGTELAEKIIEHFSA